MRRRRLGALAGAIALVFGVAAAGLAVSTSTAAAAQPIIIGDCSTTVQGAPGQPIQLKPSAVVQPVANLVGAVPLLGPTLKSPFVAAFSALPPIPIGSVSAGISTISGGTIATQVVAKLRTLPLLGPVISTLVGQVQGTLTALCGVTVHGVNDTAGAVQQGTGAVEQGSKDVQKQLGIGTGSGGGSSQTGGGGPGVGSAGGGSTGTVAPPNSKVVGGIAPNGLQLYDPSGLPYSFSRSPMADYASLPFALPGMFSPAPGVRYGGLVPGYSPQFGILGGSQPDGVQAAGHAESLNAPSGNRIALPVLLAVLALSGVTAALVRTWVLRRATA